MTEYRTHGKVRSWVATIFIASSFAVGGIALTLGPTWWLFWAAVGAVVVGGVVALLSDILADVALDEPRVIPETKHYSIFGRERKKELRGGPYGETSDKPTTSDPAHRGHG